MDTLTVKALQLEGKHGFLETERENGNCFEIDVTVRGDFRQAAKTDDLELSFNYETVVEEALSVMNGPSKKLIETLCHTIGEALFNRNLNITYLEVALRKLNPPVQAPVAYTEIRMEWRR